MQGGLDAKQLGSELRRQYAKRNRAQVMIDFLETSGIGSDPVTSGRPGRPGQFGRPNPSESYQWREQGNYANRPAYNKRARPQASAEDFEEVCIGACEPDPTEANDRELI